mgnify:CR=1 FL=1
MDIGHPDLAEFGLLIPYVDDVVGSPLPAGFAQADAFTDARNRHRLDAVDALMRFILDFDFDHKAGPALLTGFVNAPPYRSDVLRSF